MQNTNNSPIQQAEQDLARIATAKGKEVKSYTRSKDTFIDERAIESATEVYESMSAYINRERQK